MAKVWKKLQRADSAFTGDVTGTINGASAATIKSGSALGTSSNQDSTSTIRSGTTAANVGLGNVPNYSAATMRAGVSASDVGLGNVPNYSAATMRGGVTASDVGLGNVANESRATILAGTFTGDVTGTVNGASAATIKSGAASGTSAKSAVDGNASITMVGGTLSIGTTVGGVYPFAVSSSGALAIAGDEFTVAATGEVSSKGNFTINQDSNGDSSITLAGDSTGTAKVEVNGANPTFDLGGSSPLGSSTLYIRRGGTGNQSRIYFYTGSTAVAGIGFANQPSAYNDQFAIHNGGLYDNTSPYFERNFSMNTDGKMGFYANAKTFAGLTIGTDGTNKGLYVAAGGVGIGGTNTNDGTLTTSGDATFGGNIGFSNVKQAASAHRNAANYLITNSSYTGTAGGHFDVYYDNSHTTRISAGVAGGDTFFNGGNSFVIGATSSSHKFQVTGTSYLNGNATFGGTVQMNGTYLGLGNGTHITCGDSGSGEIHMRPGGTNYGGNINLRAGGNGGDIRMYTGTSGTGTIALTINSSQNATFARTILSDGIAIGGTGAANTLSDYEEGSWTPVLTNGWSYSYNSSLNRYTKIGSLVQLWGHIDNITGSSSTADLQVTGLPFTVKHSAVGGDCMFKNILVYSKASNVSSYVNTSEILYFFESAGGYSWTKVSTADLTSGAGDDIYFSIQYETDQ